MPFFQRFKRRSKINQRACHRSFPTPTSWNIGVQESIVAAALARNGHKVLHLDRNDYYSGEWASFHLKGMLDWIKRNQSSDVDRDEVNEPEEGMEEGLHIVPLPTPHKTATNIQVEIHVKEKFGQLGPADLSSKIKESGPPRCSTSSTSSGVDLSSTSSGVEASSASSVDPSSTSSGVEASSTSSVDPLSTNSGVEASSASSVDPSSTSSGVEASSTSSVDPLSTNSGVEASSTSSVDPSSTSSGVEASCTISVDPSSTSSGVEASSASCGVDPSSTSSGVEASSTSSGVEASSTSSGVDPSSTSSGVDPSSTSSVDPSSTSSGVEASSASSVDPSSTSSGVDPSTYHAEQERHCETTNSCQDVIDTNDCINDESLEMGQNQSPTSQPIDESTNEVTTPDQQSTQHILSSASTEEKQRDWTWEDIMKDWRKFNIDLAPKLMFCRGAMVELLVSSRISRYAEFKAVTRILTHISGKLEQVPCSRADVFSSRYVSVLEKRMLMKIIEFCLDHENRQDEYRDYMDKPFAEFLQYRKLSPTLQHFVIHSIAMTSSNTPTQKALQAMKYFLSSLGRYGNTAFLWTLYGSGELPQCFCRMCAVFGGIYVLRTSIRSMITDSENNIKGIIDSEGRRLKCRNLILEQSYAYGQSTPYNASYLSRGILITDKSIKQSTTEQITFLTIPPCDDRDQPVHVIEVGYAACAAPPNLYVVHLTARAKNKDVSAKDDLHHIVNTFFQVASKGSAATEDNDEPRILWSVFFTQEDVTDIPDDILKGTLPGNVHVTSGAGRSIGFDHAVTQAKQIFEKLCPGEDFLPPAPDPEDLVFEDPAKENTSQVGFDSSSTSEEGKETSMSEEGKETSMSEEGNETSMSEEGKVTSMSEEGKETSMSEEGKETSMSEKGKVTSMSEEGKETSMSEEGKETSMSEEGKETSMSEEGKETSMSEEGKETSMSEEGKETSMSEEGKVTSMSEEGKVTSMSEEGKETSMSEEGKVTSMSEKGKETSMSEEGKETSMSEEGKETSMSEEGKETSMSEEGKETSMSEERKETSISEEGKVTSMSEEGKETSMSEEGKETSMSEEGKETSMSEEGKETSMSEEGKEISMSEERKETSMS